MTWNGGSLGTFVGRDAYMAFASANIDGAFEGMQLTIHDVIARDDKVVLRFTNSGTNVGSFMGRPPSNRRAEWLGIGIYTVREGRIEEGWFAEDILGLLQHLGRVSEFRVDGPTPADPSFRRNSLPCKRTSMRALYKCSIRPASAL